MSYPLVEKVESSGSRHYVNGRDVHCGNFLQWTPDSGRTWINVRYETTSASMTVRASLIAVLYAPDGSRIYPSADARFRWPMR